MRKPESQKTRKQNKSSFEGICGEKCLSLDFFGRGVTTVPNGGGQQLDWFKPARRVRQGVILGGGFKYFVFSPLIGEDFQFD